MKKKLILFLFIAISLTTVAQTPLHGQDVDREWTDIKGDTIQGTRDWAAKIKILFYTQKKNKEKELEELMNQKPITLSEYHECEYLLEKCREQEIDDQLIIKMADYYSLIDMDNLDDFDNRIIDCILSLRLREADSLIDAKGDILTRRKTLLRHQQDCRKTVWDGVKNSSDVDARKTKIDLELEDLAKDIYYKAEIFKILNEWDSASRYLALRADLASCNVKWQLEAGELGNALFYYTRALSQALEQYGPIHPEVADCYIHIGDYLYVVEYESYYSLGFYEKALSVYESLYGKKHLSVANTYYKIGKTFQYDASAIDYYNMALDTYLSVFDDENHLEVAQVYYAIGDWYEHQNVYTRDTMCEHAYMKALSIEMAIYGDNNELMAERYRELGDKANELRFDVGYKALNLYRKALIIDTVNNNSWYYIFQDYKRIGDVYIILSHSLASKYYHPHFIKNEYLKYALDSYKKGYNSLRMYCNGGNGWSSDHHSNLFNEICARLSCCYHRIGGEFFINGEYDNAVKSYQKSLEYFRHKYFYELDDSHERNEYYEGNAYTIIFPPLLLDSCEYYSDEEIGFAKEEREILESLGAVYAAQNKYEIAINKYYHNVISFLEQEYEDSEYLSYDDSLMLANCCQNCGILYKECKRNDLAGYYIDKAAGIYLDLRNRPERFGWYNNKNIALCDMHYAEIMYEEFEYDMALKCVDAAQSYLQEREGYLCYAVCHLLRGDVFLKKGMLDHAKMEYELALKVFDCEKEKQSAYYDYNIPVQDYEDVIREYGLALDNYQHVLSDCNVLLKSEIEKCVNNVFFYDYSDRDFIHFNLDSSWWLTSDFYTVDPLLFKSLWRICSLSSDIENLKTQIKESKRR